MFLHALLFFLLATSVFASSARTKPARVGVSHPQYQPKVEAGDDTVGVWYPIEGVGLPADMVIKIPPSGHIKFGKLRALNGAMKIHDRQLTMEDYELIASKSTEYRWRRFPTRSTAFECLLDCLSIVLVDEGRNVDLELTPCESPSEMVTITNWAKNFNYWYQVPLLGKGNPSSVSAPVLQFNSEQDLVGIHNLGKNGGVDLSSIVRPPDFDLHVIKGSYRRVPNPEIPLALRHDEMNIRVDTVLGHTGHTVIVRAFQDSHPNPGLAS